MLKLQRPVVASENLPVLCGKYRVGFVWVAVCVLTRKEVGEGGVNGLLVGSSIFWIVPATQAASRLTMNSKPSLEIRVTNGGLMSTMVGSGCGACTMWDMVKWFGGGKRSMRSILA